MRAQGRPGRSSRRPHREYSELAERLRNPKADCAVARGCANNPVSVFVPRHRVVRRDGRFAGYRCGLACEANSRARGRMTGAARTKTMKGQ
ncbi:MAG: methylated-DNA--[protein]-cysteine S-methyltransferase [Stellaceae bacterium]